MERLRQIEAIIEQSRLKAPQPGDSHGLIILALQQDRAYGARRHSAQVLASSIPGQNWTEVCRCISIGWRQH